MSGGIRRRGHLVALLALLMLAQAPAQADSACWPEVATLGRNTSALLRMRTGGPYEVATYTRAGQAAPAVDCRSLFFVKGGCDLDYAIAPIDAHPSRPGLARVHRSEDGAPLWVRAATLGEVTPLLPLGRQGLLQPANAPLRVAPSLNAAAVRVDPALAGRFQAQLRRHPERLRLAGEQPTGEAWRAEVRRQPVPLHAWVRALGRVHNAEGEWIRVSERLAASVDGLARTLGPLRRSGYLLHRDARGTVQAVIEDDYCD